MENNEHKKDGRAANGGFRHNAGRKPGTGVESVNKVIRMPTSLIAEAEKAGVKKGKYTKMFLDGFKAQLKAFIRNKSKGKGNE